MDVGIGLPTRCRAQPASSLSSGRVRAEGRGFSTLGTIDRFEKARVKRVRIEGGEEAELRAALGG